MPEEIFRRGNPRGLRPTRLKFFSTHCSKMSYQTIIVQHERNYTQHENLSEEEIRIARHIFQLHISYLPTSLNDEWAGTTDRMRQAEVLALILIREPEKFNAMMRACYPTHFLNSN